VAVEVLEDLITTGAPRPDALLTLRAYSASGQNDSPDALACEVILREFRSYQSKRRLQWPDHP
jgi:hypothetical protein